MPGATPPATRHGGHHKTPAKAKEKDTHKRPKLKKPASKALANGPSHSPDLNDERNSEHSDCSLGEAPPTPKAGEAGAPLSTMAQRILEMRREHSYAARGEVYPPAAARAAAAEAAAAGATDESGSAEAAAAVDVSDAGVEAAPVASTSDTSADELEVLRAALKKRDSEIELLRDQLSHEEKHDDAVAKARASEALRGIEMMERVQDRTQDQIDAAVAEREAALKHENEQLQAALEEMQQRHEREREELDALRSGAQDGDLSATLSVAAVEAAAEEEAGLQEPSQPPALQRLMTEASVLLGTMELVRKETRGELLRSSEVDAVNKALHAVEEEAASASGWDRFTMIP